ncbi:hypothetical protein H5P28_10745 [Ruficoccus amylovorans]|uniref:EF-hand domain-containing protein n=1 Tax=Ruficoccus amylovorans TaxID=1804625 RepID=A0A842HFB8_9BACT|nr:hypothetical protein [Ruficoccus amylovorans]MBC2594738.1 hypothetical protein [Ruficoccus amylovorans]
MSKVSPGVTPAVRYFRAGGFNQLYLSSADDLKALAGLDQTLWVASSCPTTGLDMDEKTLGLMDTDGDGRIRVPEVMAAINWTLSALKDISTLPEGRDWLALEQIATDTDIGARLHESVKRILRNLDRHEDTRISLADALDRKGIFAVAKSNGDGVIPVTAADGPAVGQIIQDILDTVGGATDRSGAPGVTAEGVTNFYTSLQAYIDWWSAGHPEARNLLVPEGEPQADLSALDPAIFPLGEQTAAASAAVEAIAAKVEDFFENCEMAAFDAQAVSFFNFSERDLSQLGGRTKSEVQEVLRDLPLARVQADRPLPLSEGVNPYYASALAALSESAVAPVLGEGKQSLTRQEWDKLRASFAAYRAWIAAKAGADVEKLGLSRIAELLRDNKRSALEVLIKLDEAIAEEILSVDEVEKILRYHRDLFRLLNNYVALPEFYDTDRRAVFQMGKLIIDGCSLSLCVDVDDINRHSLIAAKSGIFLAYCELSRKDVAAKRIIAAAVTQRGVGRITVGKNAVFYDRYGRDWDAKVVKTVENPVSLREAALAPFKKLAALVSSQVDKLTSAREKAIESSLTTGIQNAGQKIGEKPAATPAAAPSGGVGVGGMLAGGGVALAALTSSFAFIAQSMQKISAASIFYTIGIILLFILVPALVTGFFKLRARDIGMILEACGWAINGRMRITLNVARQLMHVGRFSKGSERIYPTYAEKRGGLWRWIFFPIFIGLAIYCAIWLGRILWTDKEAEVSPPPPVAETVEEAPTAAEKDAAAEAATAPDTAE